jgi:hypothetical protein
MVVQRRKGKDVIKVTQVNLIAGAEERKKLKRLKRLIMTKFRKVFFCVLV